MLEVTAVTVIIQLIFLECVLSIDNAAVLGAMVAHLPIDRPTPWPRVLRPLFSRLNPILGSQRQAALKVGLLGAYGGRALMLILASIIIKVWWVPILGSLYLLYLGINYFAEYHQKGHGHEDNKARLHRRGGFWSVVLAVELADLAFSLDNVVAAVALSRDLWVVLLGVAIGIVSMRFAATLFTRMIAWEPALEDGAYLLLLFIGGKFLLESGLEWHVGEYVQFGISLGLLVLTIVVARVRLLRSLLIVFRPSIMCFALIQAGVGLVLNGLSAPVRLLSAKAKEQAAESELAG